MGTNQCRDPQPNNNQSLGIPVESVGRRFGGDRGVKHTSRKQPIEPTRQDSQGFTETRATIREPIWI